MNVLILNIKYFLRAFIFKSIVRAKYDNFHKNIQACVNLYFSLRLNFFFLIILFSKLSFKLSIFNVPLITVKVVIRIFNFYYTA